MNRLDVWAPRVLSVVRIVAGLLFMAHGLQKLVGFPVPPGAGLPPAGSLLWIGAVLETVGGAMVVLGLFTRVAAFVLSGEMAFGYFLFHAPRSFYPAVNGGDGAVLFCFLFLYLVFAGAGPWSLDRAVLRRA